MNRVVAAGGVVSIVALLIYLGTLCPTIWPGDSGELATVAATLGIAHPPGYPLWTLLGRLAVVAGPGEPALATNFLSAIAGAAAAGLLAVLLHLLTGRLLASAGIALAFALSRAVWATSIVTEVYSLNLLLTVAALTAAVGARRGRPRLFVLAAYLLGLGLGNHPFVLLAGPPVLLLALLADARHPEETEAERWRRLVPMAIAFLFGLGIYLYLPIRWAQNPVVSWGGIREVGGFVDHVLRLQYGGLGEATAETSLRIRWGMMLRVLHTSVPVPLMLLGGFGIARSAVRGHPQRAGLVALFFLLAGPVTAVLIRYEDTFLDESIVTAFFLPAVLGLFIAAGLGLAAIESAIARRLEGHLPAVRLAATGLAMVAPAALFGSNRVLCDRSDATIARVYAERVLAALPPGARIFAQGDNALFPLLYARIALRQRPDVILSDHSQNLLIENWGSEFAALSRTERRRRRAQRQVEIAFEEPERPVYFTERAELTDFGGSRLAASGYVFQLLRPGEAPRPTTHVAVDLPPGDPADYLASHLAGVAAYREGGWLARLGRPDEARARYLRAAEHGRRIPALLRSLGLAHLELTDLELAEVRFLQAVTLEPDHADALYNLAILCAHTNRNREALAWFERIEALETGQPEVPMSHAVELIRAGRLVDARLRVERALELAPDLESAHELRETITRGLEIGGEAGVLEAQRGLDGLTVSGTLQLAQRYLDRGDWGRATELYREAGTISPESAGAMYGLGYGLLQVREYDEAAVAFRRLLEIDSQSPDARNALAYIFAVKGDSLDTAERLVLEAMELNPDMDAYWHDTLGWVRYRAGDHEGALEALRIAERELPPGDFASRAETEYHLGSVLLALDRPDEAREYFVRSLARAGDGVWVPDLKARVRGLDIGAGT